MISGFYGKPRSGKTTVLAYYAAKELRKKSLAKRLPFFNIRHYKDVLSNVYISGTKKIEISDIGKYDMEDCLILIDEASLEIGNRDWKENSKTVNDFWAVHGHYHCDIIWVSQSDDVDKKLRDRTQQLYKIKKLAWWTISTKIFSICDVDQNTHQIVFGWRLPTGFETLIGAVFGLLGMKSLAVRKWYFRPFYYKYFDSWERKRLIEKYFIPWDNVNAKQSQVH